MECVASIRLVDFTEADLMLLTDVLKQPDEDTTNTSDGDEPQNVEEEPASLSSVSLLMRSLSGIQAWHVNWCDGLFLAALPQPLLDVWTECSRCGLDDARDHMFDEVDNLLTAKYGPQHLSWFCEMRLLLLDAHSMPVKLDPGVKLLDIIKRAHAVGCRAFPDALVEELVRLEHTRACDERNVIHATLGEASDLVDACADLFGDGENDHALPDILQGWGTTVRERLVMIFFVAIFPRLVLRSKVCTTQDT